MSDASFGCVKERFEIGGLGEDVSCDSESLGPARKADVPGLALGNQPLEITLGGLETNHSRIERVGGRVGQPETGLALDAISYSRGQLMNSLIDSIGSNALEKIQCRFQADHDRQI